MHMSDEIRLKSIAAALSLMICAASVSGSVSAGTNDVWLTDIASLSGDSSWRAMTYETCDGIKGTLLHASWGMDPCKPIRIPLGVRGRHRIFLGLAGMRGAMSSQAPFSALVRLERDPAPVRIGSPANSRDSGWWFQPVEVEWKTVDLADDTLIVARPGGCRTLLAWVRLEPVHGAPAPAPKKRFVVSNDAYRPYDTMDELRAPIMRFADSSVRAIYYCVGNGPFTFAASSKVAYKGWDSEGHGFSNPYAAKCARTFDWLHRDHPRLVDELADFAHGVGLEFHVSFRTGCHLDFMRFDSPQNAFGANTNALFRAENHCRLWDGTPVTRLSYAHPDVQEFFLRFYAEQLTEKVDGINIIWIRAMPAMLFEQAFRDRFKRAYGEELSREDDPRIVALRKEIMTDYMRRVRGIAGGKRVSMVVPATGAICESFGLDIARLAREGIVDEFDVGDSLQTARHAESFAAIDFAYFRKALAGSGATFLPFLWTCEAAKVRKSLAESASGALLWDAGDKLWSDWKEVDALETGGYSKPTVHPFKMLDGYDAATYPWHVAY